LTICDNENARKLILKTQHESAILLYANKNIEYMKNNTTKMRAI